MSETAQARRLVVTAHGERQIKAERILDAPRERVFEAMTTPDQVEKWWGPRGSTTKVHEMDVKPGGRWRFSVDSDETQAFSGTYRVIEPPRRIEQTFEWSGMPGYISVEVCELIALGHGQTKIVATTTFHFPEERDGMLASGMEKGMGETYDRLEELLAS
jgi:uncharacterized protein YndB with AHSA1/START domain